MANLDKKGQPLDCLLILVSKPRFRQIFGQQKIHQLVEILVDVLIDILMF